jgi:hypothetical protein
VVGRKQLEPRFLGLDGSGAVLYPRAAGSAISALI